MSKSTTVGVTKVPLMDLPLENLIDDVAQAIYPRKMIAARYSLSLQELHDLIATPAVLKQIRARKQIWESDECQEKRLKAYALATLLNKLPAIANAIDDPAEPSAVRVESIKTVREIAGVGSSSKSEGITTAPFSVTINIGDGSPRIIATTVVEDITQVLEHAA